MIERVTRALDLPDAYVLETERARILEYLAQSSQETWSFYTTKVARLRRAKCHR